MEHMLLAQIQLPPDTREHRDKVFIVDHPCCDVFFGLEMENAIFDMSEEALFNPALWKDGMDVSRRLSDTVNRLIASEKSVVLMRYQPEVLQAMGDLAAEVWNKCRDVWLFFAFFHDDHDTLVMNRPLPWSTNPEPQEELERKAECILTLGRFPFVKMVETGVKDIMELKAFQELFIEYAPER